MAIISSAITVTVEPVVASIDIALSTSIMGAVTLTTVTLTALDTAGNPVPGAPMELWAVPASSNLAQNSGISGLAGSIKVASGTTNASGQLVNERDVGDLYTFTASGTNSAMAFQGYSTYADLISPILYAYPNCSISITTSNAEPEVGESFQLTATVKTIDGGIFGEGTTATEAAAYFEGYAIVTFVLQPDTVYTPVNTNGSGQSSMSLSFASTGSYDMEAVATGQTATVVS